MASPCPRNCSCSRPMGNAADDLQINGGGGRGGRLSLCGCPWKRKGVLLFQPRAPRLSDCPDEHPFMQGKDDSASQGCTHAHEHRRHPDSSLESASKSGRDPNLSPKDKGFVYCSEKGNSQGKKKSHYNITSRGGHRATVQAKGYCYQFSVRPGTVTKTSQHLLDPNPPPLLRRALPWQRQWSPLRAHPPVGSS